MHSRRAFQFVGAVLAMCIVAAVLLLLTPRSTREPASSVGQQASAADGRTVSLEAAANPAARAVPDTATVAAPAASRLTGRVRDRSLDVPLVAYVQPNVGAGMWTNAGDGAFRFGADCEPFTALRISAAGFRTEHVTELRFDAGDELHVLLEPLEVARVSVEWSDGKPAADLPIEWHAAVDQAERRQVTDWINTSLHTSGRVLATTTDSAGMASIALAVPAFAVVGDPVDGTRKTVRVAPGQDVRVVLPMQPIHIRFVDHDTDDPLAQLEIEAWFPTEIGSMSQRLRTSTDGSVMLAATSYPILLRQPGSKLWQAELVPLSPGLSKVGTGGPVQTMIRIDAAPVDEHVIVGVRPCGGQLRLIDDATDQPVDRSLRMFVRPMECASDSTLISDCTLYSPKLVCDTPDEIYVSRAGLVTLPCLLPLAELSDAAGEFAVVLLVDGYRTARVSTRALPSGASAAPLDVRLERATTRTLAVQLTDGSPYRQSVSIYSPRGDVIVWNDRGNATGIHGPFDWSGGELFVRVGDELGWERRIDAATLESTTTITLALPLETGSISVSGIPADFDASQLVAKLGVSLGGTVYRPTSVGPDLCRFERLPVGSYVVGPAAWVAGAEMQSMWFNPADNGVTHRTRTQVEPNAEARVPWIDTWSSASELHGTVKLSGDVREPFLVPLYDSVGLRSEERPEGMPRLVVGRRTAKIPLDRDGRYTIRAHDPLPLLLAVCVATDGEWGTVQGMQVIQTLQPGESVDVAMGSLELVWRGEPPQRPVTVRFEVKPESLRYPLANFMRSRAYEWSTHAPLRIDGVPLHVHEITLDSVPVPIELSAGSVVKSVVTSTQLASSDAAR